MCLNNKETTTEKAFSEMSNSLFNLPFGLVGSLVGDPVVNHSPYKPGRTQPDGERTKPL